jgi:hypothetical protein
MSSSSRTKNEPMQAMPLKFPDVGLILVDVKPIAVFETVTFSELPVIFP